MAAQEGGSFAGLNTARRRKPRDYQQAKPEPLPVVEAPSEAPKQARSSRGGKRSNPGWKNKGFLIQVSTSNRLDMAIAKAKIGGEEIDQSELIDQLLIDWLDSRSEELGA